MIAEGINDTQRRVEVLGDLTSAEAFVYVCGGKVRNKEGAEEEWPGLIAQSEETLALGMTPEDWKKVWSVCGGNLHLLKNCVDRASPYTSWETRKKLLKKLVFLLFLLPISVVPNI